jgi:hypothetical protein
MQFWHVDIPGVQTAKEGPGQNRVTLTLTPPAGVIINANSLVVASVTEIGAVPGIAGINPILGAATNIHLNSVVPLGNNSIQVSLFNDFTAFPITVRIYLITD